RLPDAAGYRAGAGRARWSARGLLRGLTVLTATSRQLPVPLAVGVFHEQRAMTIVDDDRRGSEHQIATRSRMSYVEASTIRETMSSSAVNSSRGRPQRD